MQETNTIRFFRELASRMYKENDLSDIVYALCESNCQFKQFFLNFFFHDFQLSATEARIQREVQYDDGSRPDFVIRCQNRTFFVESKIWDRSHHFSQYAKTLSNQEGAAESSLAYITNYKIIPESLSKADRDIFEKIKENSVHTWETFRKELERFWDDPVERSWATGEDIRGFIEYCKRVCPTQDDEKVDSFIFHREDFLGILRAYTNLKNSLNGFHMVDEKTVTFSPYPKGKYNCPGDWIGMYFSATGLLDNETVYGWMGFYLKKGTSTPGLCIEFLNKSGWGASVFKKLNHNGYQIDYCYSLADLDPGSFQKNMRLAFRDILNKIPPTNNYTNISTSPNLRKMRQFGLFLEQQVLNNLMSEQDDARLEIVQASDSQNPLGWCGVYFDVVKDVVKEDGLCEIGRARGWLGVYFDNKVRVKDGPHEDGSRIVLEWKGTTSLVDAPSDGSALDSEQIKQRVKELLTMQD